MRILILGGGEVAALVARRLIREQNEVTMVELDEGRSHHLEESLDAKIVHGNAGRIECLTRAGIDQADMLIAATNSDETNILGCLIAQDYPNVEIKLARLRTHEVDRWRSLCEKNLDVDLIIHPDREAAKRLLAVIAHPGVSDIRSFAEGRIKLFGMIVDETSWLVGKTMAELDSSDPPQNSLIPMLFRGHQVIIPQGHDVIRAGDHLYTVVPTADLDDCLSFMGLPAKQRVQRVFILGGKQIGIELALRLEKRGVQVKLFEKDLVRCEKISTLVKRSVVVHGDGSDQRLLSEENVEGIDAFLALTGHDEDNIMASLVSKRMGANKSIALINRVDLLPMAHLLGITSALSTRLVVVDRILQYARRGKVLSVKTFRDEEAEAIETVATEKSKFVGKALKDVELPRGAIIGGIVRPSGEVTVPRGDAIVQAGDRVIFFCLETLVPELESAFIGE
jgi:trk system potassium uptake protein TrkA